MTMSPKDFVDCLISISTYGGIAYGRLNLIFDEEKKHGQAACKYNIYLALSDAFKCFFLETVEIINTYCRPRLSAPLSEFYPLFVPGLVHSFKSMCGAERVAIQGYPLQGYTLLRNVFDDLLLTSAALQKFTSPYSILGINPQQPINYKNVKKLRRSTEFSVRKLMTGSESGLSPKTIDELSDWDALFDWETHGARLSLTHTKEWMEGKSPLPILPNFNDKDFGMFRNRFCEVGWMAHRLIPALQPPSAPLPSEWKSKWQIIDGCFKISIESYDKPIGPAMLEFIHSKFPFNDETVFPL